MSRARERKEYVEIGFGPITDHTGKRATKVILVCSRCRVPAKAEEDDDLQLTKLWCPECGTTVEGVKEVDELRNMKVLEDTVRRHRRAIEKGIAVEETPDSAQDCPFTHELVE